MKIAVSAMGPGPDAILARHFGRCACFVVYDMDDKTYSNLLTMAKRRVGVGIRAAKGLVGSGVRVVVAGNIGPNAYRILEAAGVMCYTGVSGTVRDCVEAYGQGRLRAVNSATALPYAGIKKAGQG